MGKTDRLVTQSADETQTFFRRLGSSLRAGDVVAFTGEMGAGKTTAIQAILRTFGVDGGESPTFVMVRPYALRKKREIESIVHVDAYRLESPADVLSTGLTDVLNDPKALVLVEWADRLRSLLPEKTIWIELVHRGQDAREIRVLRP